MTGREFLELGRNIRIRQLYHDRKIAELMGEGFGPGDLELDRLLDLRDAAAADLEDLVRRYLGGV